MSEMERIVTADEIEDASERLQSEKEKFNQASFRCGEREGRTWALDADYEELVRMEYYLGRMPLSKINPWIYLMTYLDARYWKVMTDGYVGERKTVDEESLAQGFVEGAMEIWRRIKMKLA